jgi:hypothetical protein
MSSNSSNNIKYYRAKFNLGYDLYFRVNGLIITHRLRDYRDEVHISENDGGCSIMEYLNSNIAYLITKEEYYKIKHKLIKL